MPRAYPLLTQKAPLAKKPLVPNKHGQWAPQYVLHSLRGRWASECVRCAGAGYHCAGNKPSVREQRERPAVHHGGGQDLCKEVTGEQGPHEGRGGDTWTSRQRKRHTPNRMWKGTGLLEGAAEGMVRRTGQLSSLDEWCLYQFQQPKGDKCCRLTQEKLGGVWLQAWLDYCLPALAV